VNVRLKTVIEFFTHRGKRDTELFERQATRFCFRSLPEFLNKVER
jgi:hypothetical protein